MGKWIETRDGNWTFAETWKKIRYPEVKNFRVGGTNQINI